MFLSLLGSPDLSEDCRRAIVLVRNLTYLKSKDKKGKVDKVIKTLRFNLIKGIRKGGRLDSLLTLEAAEGNEKAVLGLLEAVVGPSEEALKLVQFFFQTFSFWYCFAHNSCADE